MRNVMQAAFLSVFSLGFCGAAGAAETLTITTISDPAYEASVWAIINKKVSDPAVELKVSTQPMARNPQSTMAQEFNISSTGLQSVASLAEGGVKTKILATAYRYNPDGHAISIWVLNDSPYKTIEDLKGKTIATQGLENQGTVSVRTGIQENHHMNAATVGGDFKWVELPVPQLEPALQSHKVDASLIGTVPAYMAEKRGLYRYVFQGSKELEKLYGGPMPTVVWVGYEEQIKRKPEIYEVAVRLLRESSEYMMAHQDEVFGVVAPKYKMEVADLKGWFNRYASMPSVLTESDRVIFGKSWQQAQKIGMIQKAPNPDDFIWDRVKILK